MFLIYKYHVGETLYFLQGRVGFWLFAQYRPGEWKPGEWHHVVCHWNPVQQVMYVDGKLITERRIYFPMENLSPKKDFTIGETSKTLGASMKTGRMSLIDEFKIFDRELTAKEIKDLYLADCPPVTPKNLITAGYGSNTITAPLFINRETGEYAQEQNTFTMGFDDNALKVSLKNYPAGAALTLTTPENKKYHYSFNGKELSLPLAEMGLKPGEKGWKINIISGNSDLGGDVRLILDKNAPRFCINSICDLSANRMNLNIAPQKDIEVIFDTDTTMNYGFTRRKRNLNRALNYTSSLADRTLFSLNILKGGKELLISDFAIRKNQPLAVKFLYTKIKERKLLVAFQGKNTGNAQVEFVTPDGKTAASEILPLPQNAMTYFNMEFPIRLNPGNYDIRVSHVDGKGKKTAIWTQELRVPPADDPIIKPYIDPDKDKVPPGGWTPVVAKENTVQIWGRSFKLADGVLFGSLVTQGKELLAEPDALILNSNRLTAKSVKLKKIASDDLSATYSKELDFGNIKVNNKITIHFDGYAKISMTVIPNGTVKINSLALELPLRNEQVKLVRDNVTLSKLTGKAKDSFTVSLLPFPFLWVGDYYTGINFTEENLINWHFRNPARHAELKRDGKSARLRFLLVSALLTLNKQRDYNFGLTVTPVKPLNTALLRQRDKKDWQLTSGSRYMNYLDPNLLRETAPHYGMRHYDSQKAMFPTLFHYAAYNFISPARPE